MPLVECGGGRAPQPPGHGLGLTRQGAGLAVMKAVQPPQGQALGLLHPELAVQLQNSLPYQKRVRISNRCFLRLAEERRDYHGSKAPLLLQMMLHVPIAEPKALTEQQGILPPVLGVEYDAPGHWHSTQHVMHIAQRDRDQTPVSDHFCLLCLPRGLDRDGAATHTPHRPRRTVVVAAHHWKASRGHPLAG